MYPWREKKQLVNTLVEAGDIVMKTRQRRPVGDEQAMYVLADIIRELNKVEHLMVYEQKKIIKRYKKLIRRRERMTPREWATHMDELDDEDRDISNHRHPIDYCIIMIDRFIERSNKFIEDIKRQSIPHDVSDEEAREGLAALFG